MVFLCFSSGDRETIVQSVLYHLKKYGVSVWYDYHELTLGDDRIHGNFTNGLDLCNYAVIIISPNMFDCNCGNDELNAIKKRYIEKSIHIFPLFYNITASHLPRRYRWLTKLIYNEVDDTIGTLSACNQIVYQITVDMVKMYKIKNFEDFKNYDVLDPFIISILRLYSTIDEDNFNAKFTLLYIIYLFVDTKKVEIPIICKRILERMCTLNQLNIQMPHKELLTVENIIIIILNLLLNTII